MEEPPSSGGNYPARPTVSRSCSRAREEASTTTSRGFSRRRSGSATPVLGNIRLPSRPSSPSRLRSLPSVGVSNVEALSDGTTAFFNGNGNDMDVNSDHHHHVDPATVLSSALQEDSGKDKEASLPVCTALVASALPPQADHASLTVLLFPVSIRSPMLYSCMDDHVQYTPSNTIATTSNNTLQIRRRTN